MVATVRPPLKWHGGKFYLAKKIIGLFPEHHTYVEPFGGGASVLINKCPSKIEVYGDLDSRLTNFFRVLRDQGDELRRRLALTPYSENEFEDVSAATEEEDDVEKARRFFAQMRLSLGGRGDSFSFTLHRVRGGMADVVSAYLSAIDQVLPRIIDRLRSVQIVNRPAIEIIQRWDDCETLFYLDPPYLASTRAEGSRDVYGVEMTEQDHRELAAELQKCKGKVILSGYPSDLYDELYSGWRVEQIEIANHAAGGAKKAREIECLWMNWS